MTDRRPERAAALLLLTAHADTLATMLERAGLPPLANGGDA